MMKVDEVVIPNAPRRMVLGGLLSTGISAAGGRALAQGSDVKTEVQQGDPLCPPEQIVYRPKDTRGLIEAKRARFRPRSTDFPGLLITTAKRFVGVNRSNNHDQVADFLEVFNLPFEQRMAPHGELKPLAFCAAGVGYTAAIGYLSQWGEQYDDLHKMDAIRGALPELDHYHFYPSPSVADMYYVALGKGRWVARGAKSPEPGWLVVYDWKRRQHQDHVGIIQAVEANRLHTIEFNTSTGLPGDQSNGGHVAERERPLDGTVLGFINTSLN